MAGEGIDRALQASAMCLPGEEPCGAKRLHGRERRLLHVQSRYDHFNHGLGGSAGCRASPVSARSGLQWGILAGAFFETGLGRFDAEHDVTG